MWQKWIWRLKISFASRFVFPAIIYGRARARRGEKKLEITLEAD
jgi:hypothetical protein